MPVRGTCDFGKTRSQLMINPTKSAGISYVYDFILYWENSEKRVVTYALLVNRMHHGHNNYVCVNVCIYLWERERKRARQREYHVQSSFVEVNIIFRVFERYWCLADLFIHKLDDTFQPAWLFQIPLIFLPFWIFRLVRIFCFSSTSFWIIITFKKTFHISFLSLKKPHKNIIQLDWGNEKSCS